VIVSRTADVAGVTVLVAAPVARHGAHPRHLGWSGQPPVPSTAPERFGEVVVPFLTRR